MRGAKPLFISVLLLLMLIPVALAPGAFGEDQARAPDVTPQSLSERRVRLYFQAARQPLAQLAPAVYEFAADSERCRLDHGAKECGLPVHPLNSTDLKEIYDYYVKQPVEATLSQQRVAVSKNNWAWQASVKPH
jgi:hypothetical protein